MVVSMDGCRYRQAVKWSGILSVTLRVFCDDASPPNNTVKNRSQERKINRFQYNIGLNSPFACTASRSMLEHYKCSATNLHRLENSSQAVWWIWTSCRWFQKGFTCNSVCVLSLWLSAVWHSYFLPLPRPAVLMLFWNRQFYRPQQNRTWCAFDTPGKTGAGYCFCLQDGNLSGFFMALAPTLGCFLESSLCCVSPGVRSWKA